MRGSVVSRTDGKGRARYFVLVEERTSEGRRRRRWHSDPSTGSGFTSKRAAEAYAASMVAAVANGAYVTPSKETLGDWLTTWLQVIQPSLKPSTWASYEKNVRVHVVPALGDRELKRLTPVDLDTFYGRLLLDGRRMHGRPGGLAPRTVRYIATILKRALKDAVRKGLIPRNPADAADPPKLVASPRHAQAWTADELAAFLTATAEHRHGLVWAFLASTGCRRGEALGMRWADLHTGADGRTRASFLQSVQKVRGRVLVGTTKSAASRRVVVLDERTSTRLEQHRRAQAEVRRLVGPGWTDNDLVFAQLDGRPLYPETISRAFREAADRLQLPAITLHGLRHTWATLALQAGVHPKIVQERLGHANVSITLNIYSHVAPAMHGDAAETVAALVANAGAAADRKKR